MLTESPLQVSSAIAATLPSWPDIVGALRSDRRPRAVDRLRQVHDRPMVQPRCGVGGQAAMEALLRSLDRAGPDMLSLTIDSYTRLGRFDAAARVLREDPALLNGYPLVTHGWQRGRELSLAVDVPLEIRHGSPEARDLFAVSLAAGITSFEGGGIGYNLPYCKDVPLRDSLTSWAGIDMTCGELSRSGVIVDRELFGTLTGVLVPPSISLAIVMIEACLAAEAGVQCLSIAYPQGGELHQDVAALRAIPLLARRLLPPDVEVFPVLHEFMGVFPRHKPCADALIAYGGLTARLGRATKIVNKTNQEAHGLPDAASNMDGIRTARHGASIPPAEISIDEDAVADECDWIVREVLELVDPVLQAADRLSAIVIAFAEGRLDVPFSASRHAQSAVVPGRTEDGTVRYRDIGRLPFSGAVRRHNAARLPALPADRLIATLTEDINYFACDGGCAARPTWSLALQGRF